MNDDIIECPCYHVCSALGIETRTWCRYRKSDLPPPGLHNFNPKDTWCPPGVQANVLMLGYMVAGETRDRERLEPVLDQVRNWAAELRRQRGGYDPARPREK